MLQTLLIPMGFTSFILAMLVTIACPKTLLPWPLRIFVVIIGCAALQISLVQSGLARHYPFMAFFMDSFHIAIAPLTYIYLRQLGKFKMLNWQYALHFLPPILSIVAMIPYWLKSHSLKLEYQEFAQHSAQWFWPSNSATVIVMLVQFLLYSPFILIEYQRRIRLYDNQIPNHRHWLHWLMGTYYGQWLILGTLAILQFEMEIMGLVLLGLFVFLMGLTAVLLKQPFAIMGQKPKAITVESWRAQLSQDGLSQLQDRLHQYMHVSRCYLDAGLTLKSLAEQMKTQPSKLTKVFSQHLNESFYDYINKLRVEAAKEMLIDSGRKHLSVTDIMAQAGFNSNSVFYESFKRLTGKTPAQYRKGKLLIKAHIKAPDPVL
jgi:AraC-like DNA-binding protein